MTSFRERPDGAVGAAADEDTVRDVVADLVALARPARRIVAFTGAGISTESGIPDYRGPGGVWERQAPPTIGDFRENPETRRAYWERRRDGYPTMAAAEPNPGHRALVALERLGRLSAIVTQNIDGLHQKAGSDPDRVIELHGTTHAVRCLDCGRSWPAAAIQRRLEAGDRLPACEVCGGPLRAATVLFGEPLPAEALRRAAQVTRDSDLMLVVGSSLVVNPAAQLPRLAKQVGARLAIVNRTPTLLDTLADVRAWGEAGETLTGLVEGLRENDGGHSTPT
ncbi:MAG: NAD-dependent deacylase [Chloroflexota bacterium]|nr:NAD-dependent deacylase [Chloroflexota bacterium]